MVILLALSGCAPDHFSSVVRSSASARADYCGGEIGVERLNTWAYRVEACERATFYRCYFKRQTFGRTQCCEPMPDESSATAVFGLHSDEVTCKDF